MTHERGSAVSVALIAAVEAAANGQVYTAKELAEISEEIWRTGPTFQRMLAAMEEVAWALEEDGDDPEWDEAVEEFHEAIAEARS